MMRKKRSNRECVREEREESHTANDKKKIEKSHGLLAATPYHVWMEPNTT